jgi:hypothetical protein
MPSLMDPSSSMCSSHAGAVGMLWKLSDGHHMSRHVATCHDMSLGIIGYPKMMDLTIHEDVKVRTKLWIP